jgi:PAS domain S-box-containing protein
VYNLTQEGIEALWNQGLVGVLIVDVDCKIISANPAICELMEYTELELKTKTFMDITHPEDLQFDLALTEECIKGIRDGYDMPKRYITKFGHVITILLRVIAVRNNHGEFMYFLSQVIPLSARQPNLTAEQLQSLKREGQASAVANGLSQFIQRRWERVLVCLLSGIVGLLTWLVSDRLP